MTDNKDNIMEAIKTYGTGIYAWFLIVWQGYVPKDYCEWTEVFNMCAALLALILIALRFKNDIFHKSRRKKK